MASEKAQKLPTEAFTRLRTDHEHFLEAYEKPTQIYRFLRARHALKPIFLHRNLSYMQQHGTSARRPKRRKRLRLNDLLKHTKEKPDLASEIKSDNHLKISFYGLEKGVDFQQLLANGGWSRNSQKLDRSHDSHMTMDVEVLLYRFSQPSTKALTSNPTSHPCECISLGKLALGYSPTANATAAEIEAKLSKDGSSQVLTIPESRLNCGKNSCGTLMLVFRACPHDLAKKRSLVKKVNRKALSSVSIELNRLNHSELASQLAKAKLHSQSQFPQAQVPAATQQSDSPSSTTLPAMQAPAEPNHTSSAAASITDSEAMDHSCSGSSAPAPGVAQGRASSKARREKRDACVMTDLIYGTELYSTLAPPSPLSPPSTPSRTIGAFSSKLPQINSLLPLDPLSPACPSVPPRKGFTDRSTSPLIPKLQFKNGMSSINGLLLPNGSASLEELEAGSASDDSLKHSSHVTEGGVAAHPSRQLAETNGTSGDDDSIASVKGAESVGNAVTSEVQSLIVSIPHALYQHSRSSSISSITSDSSTATHPFVKKYLPGQHGKRRSEIQLLLDGDKPKAKRISSKEIPVVTAEDISSRMTRSSGLTRGPWLSSTTRKVTPVELFGCPLSPTSPRWVPSPVSPTPLLNSTTSRKRKLSETISAGTSSPPPRKLLKFEHEKDKTSPPSSPPPPCTPPSPPPCTPPPPPPCTPPPPPSPPVAPTQKEATNPLEAETSAGPPPPVAPTQKKATNPLEPETSAAPPPYSHPPADHRTNRPFPMNKPSSTHIQPDFTRTIFTADLVVFDSRGDCLLEDGVYSLLMQHCPKNDKESSPGLSSFIPLTWASIFGNDVESKEGRAEEDGTPSNMLLKFKLQWTKGPPKFRLASCLQTALDLEKLREAYYPPLSPSPLPQEPSAFPISQPLAPPTPPEPWQKSLNGGSTHMDVPVEGVTAAGESMDTLVVPWMKPRIFLNFLYNQNTVEQTELKKNFSCPWCASSCVKLYSLLKHMSLCHPRFLYTYTPVDSDMAIDVHVNKLYNTGSSSPDPGMRHNLSIIQSRKGPAKCLPRTAVLVERHAEVEEDLSEFLNDGTWKRGYNNDRIYYHSRSCLPMLSDEINRDSEQEEETLQWKKICSQKMIEDFTDVNRGEKELMKLWNEFAMEEKLIANKQIPDACLRFATQKRHLLREKGIFYNFMTHLISLCDYGVIAPGVLRSAMLTVYGVS